MLTYLVAATALTLVFWTLGWGRIIWLAPALALAVSGGLADLCASRR